MGLDKISIKFFGDLWAIPNVNIEAEISSSDIVIGNLETPITNSSASAEKAGPSIKGSARNFKTICKQLGNLNLVVANNHIMDYGNDGLTDTLRVLKQSKISYCGAGIDINEARKPLIIDVKSIKIAIIAAAEIQFGLAQRNRAGYNPFTSKIYAQIIELKKTCDIVIVSIHASAEMSPVPSPSWQDTMRSLIDVGADIVHGHHSHVPQGYEKYKQGVIFYGLGNFIADAEKWNEYNNTLWSLTPVITYRKGRIDFVMKTAVIKKNKEGTIVRYANEEELENHVNYIAIWNNALADRELLEALWQEYSIILYETHFGKWLGLIEETRYIDNVSLRSKMGNIKQAFKELLVSKKTEGNKSITTKQQQLLWYHLFSCVSHKSIISTALGVLSGELKDLRTKDVKKNVSNYFQL